MTYDRIPPSFLSFFSVVEYFERFGDHCPACEEGGVSAQTLIYRLCVDMCATQQGASREPLASFKQILSPRGCRVPLAHHWTTNNKQQTTNNKQQTTNNKQQTTNKQHTTNNKQQTTNNKQQTTHNKQQTTNNKQQTTTLRWCFVSLVSVSKLVSFSYFSYSTPFWPMYMLVIKRECIWIALLPK